MKKRLFSLLLLLVAISLHVFAQRLIVNASLKNVLGEDVQAAITPVNKPDSLSGWNFESCSTAESGTTYVSVASGGSVTTCPLVGVTGNAIVSVMIKALVNNFTLSIAVEGNGILDVPSVSGYTKGSWNRSLPILLRNANSSSRVRFSGNGAFEIVNIIITDIDDGVFYESFGRCNSTGGNDGDFSPSSAASITSTQLDNPFSTDDCATHVMPANKCAYLADNGIYNIVKYPSSGTGSHMLSFKVGRTKSNSSLSVITYNENVEEVEQVVEGIPLGEWKSYHLLLPNVNTTYVIKFKASCVYLDDILLSEIKYMDLDEGVDNSDVLTEREGKTVYARLTRTLAANIWNTCCLPFSLTAEQLKSASGIADLTVEMMRLNSISDGVFTFETTTSVAAGEPFFVRVDQAVANPVFSNVSIEAVEPSCISDEGYGFQGIYSRTSLNTDGTHVFLGTDGELHTPSSNNSMKGMRAYFVVPQGGEARVAFIDGDDVTSVGSIRESKPSAASCLYNMQGQRVSSLAKGLFVQNGKKIFVK